MLAFDAGVVSNGSGVSSLTYSHTVGSGSNTIICSQPTLVDSIEGAAAISSISYAATNLSLISGTSLAFTFLGQFDIVMEEWILAAPATGANNIVITCSETVGGIIGGSQSWFGADQSGMAENGTTNTAATGQPAVTVNSASSRQVLAHAWALQSADDGLETSEVERWDYNGGASSSGAVGASQDGAASVTMDWTGAIDTFEWGATGFSLIPAGGALSSVGTGTMTAAGASSASAALSFTGTSTMIMRGAALASAAASAAGSAIVAFSGASSASAALSADGLSTVDWVGESAAAGAAALHAAGSSTVIWVGESVAAAALFGSGEATVDWVGAGGAVTPVEEAESPEVGQGGAWGRWSGALRGKTRRRRELEREDEEIIAAVKALGERLLTKRTLH